MTLAMTAVDLFTDPELVVAVKAEHRTRVGPDFVYKALVRDRLPCRWTTGRRRGRGGD